MNPSSALAGLDFISFSQNIKKTRVLILPERVFYLAGSFGFCSTNYVIETKLKEPLFIQPASYCFFVQIGIRFTSGRNIYLRHGVQTGSRPTHISTISIWRALSLGLKRPGREADLSPLPNESSRTLSFKSTLLHAFVACVKKRLPSFFWFCRFYA